MLLIAYAIIKVVTAPKGFERLITGYDNGAIESLLRGIESYDPFEYYDRMIAEWGNVERGTE